MKIIITSCAALLVALLELQQQACGQQTLEAFTHPVECLSHKVSIYSAPNVHYMEISSSTEAGWIVQVYERQGNYFRIDIEDLELYNVWIHCGDIGVNIQNYDSINIPLFSA